jgi:pimeloyl-ACP methyl ester carboxylesterase
MKRAVLVSVFVIVTATSVFAQLLQHQILPNQTDSEINGNNPAHHIYINKGVAALDKLLLFFPGTTGTPRDYRLFQRTAADMGYHVIGLSYENLASININICPRTFDSTCHGRARYEIWFGEDQHPAIEISPANSILNRLLRLLQYLQTTYPEENWQQFLDGSAIKWERIVTAGHSQGGGHAAFAAKLFPVNRVIMISWTDWAQPGKTASWIREPGATPDSAYFGFIHTGDASIYAKIPITWSDFHMLQFGPIVNIDTTSYPYLNSHSLITSVPIDTVMTQANFHNATCVDWVTPIDQTAKTPLLQPVWQYLLGKVTTTDPNALRISPEGGSYIDPELLSIDDKLAFQSSGGTVYLSDIDPHTGAFVSASGKDLLIDTEATPLIHSFNGPEFGIDAKGWSLFYTKDNGGTPQIWRADVNISDVTRTALTTGLLPKLSTLASKDVTANSIKLLFSRGAFLKTGVVCWIDEDQPEREIVVDSIDTGTRWVDSSNSFFYVKQTGKNAGQLFLYHTGEMTEKRITDDPDRKSYSYGWFAPEYDELLVLAVLSDTAIAIYRDHGAEFWQKIATLTAPPSSEYKYIGSPEPFVAAGKSYISFVCKKSASSSQYVDAEVWVSGIETDNNTRFIKRCDSGLPNTIRTDPESYIGADQVFIYYNVLTAAGTFEIWRYASDILTAQTDVKGDQVVVPDGFALKQNYPNPFNPATVIEFNLPEASQIELKIYDLLGRKVATLVDTELQAGRYKKRFNAENLANGLYIYRLSSPYGELSKKMLYIK